MHKLGTLFLCLAFSASMALVAGLASSGPAAMADPTIPATWDIVTEGFESGSLGAWNTENASRLSLVSRAGYAGSTGLSVAVGPSSAYIYQTRVAKATEGYLTFWFNPNGVLLPDPFTYWPPENALCVASVVSSVSDWWPPMVSLYVRQPAGQGYKGFLAWPKATGYFYDYDPASQFDLTSGWQKITLGYRIDAWVAVWVNDSLVRYYTDVQHDDPYGDVIELGKVNSNSKTTPGGAVLLDDVAFQVPRVDDLWVDAVHGNESNDGRTAATAFRTIQTAADLAGPGTVVHILPGVYRETVWPALNGSAAEAAVYQAESGPGTAILRGSEPSSSLTWTQLAANTIGLPPGVDATRIYYADLSAWNLSAAPRFVVQLDAGGQVSARLPLAREPDWSVATEWKVHEFWWAADGGSGPATCDPVTNADHDCDLSQRSMTQLTDRTNDAEPASIEAGNLTTLGNLTGATLVAIDTVQGHYTYRRTIVSHDVANGRITVDRACEHDTGTGNPGLGWGTKYYVEGTPRLLDSPGEWWYNPATHLLYLWPLTPANPATLNIEISRRDRGFDLHNHSYVTLDGLAVEFVNGSAVYQGNWTNQRSYHNTVRNVSLRYANIGVWIEQDVSAGAPTGNVIDGFTLEDSEIAYMDTLAVRLTDWWENDAAPASFTRSGVRNTLIRGNEMHHLGFRTDGDNAVGLYLQFANKLRFEDNHVHHVAHNGVQFGLSVIQSAKSYGFAPGEIKTGEILIKDNLFEKACQQTTDCGAVKFWGDPPQSHVFRDVLITGNVFRDTFGWSYVAAKRGRYTGGTASQVRGMGGYGLFVDNASGLHVYRNISYNNAYAGYLLYGVWRDGDIVFTNNVAANSLYGFSLGGPQYDTHGSVNTQFLSNIVANNEGYGFIVSGANRTFRNVTLNNNLYWNNGWRPYVSGGIWDAGDMVVATLSPNAWTRYQTLAAIRANTAWEAQGVEGNPAFWSYDSADHDMHDSSRPDLHLTAASTTAIDRGTAALPASLTTLLSAFVVEDLHWGAAFDIGRYEGGLAILADPPAQAIEPGGTALYRLRLYPPDLPYSVALAVTSPSPSLIVALSPTSITSGQTATLTITDTHGGGLQPGLWYTVPIAGSGGGFAGSGTAGLLVGGARAYMPMVERASP